MSNSDLSERTVDRDFHVDKDQKVQTNLCFSTS